MKIFFLILTLFLAGCTAGGSALKRDTHPAADVQWTVMQHYTKPFVCSDLSDAAYFNMIWEEVEDDMTAVAKRRNEPAENISIYKKDLQKEVIEKRAFYRSRYGCLAK